MDRKLEGKSVWNSLLRGSQPVSSRYLYEGLSPFDALWYMGRERHQQGYERNMPCLYLVPESLWETAHHIYSHLDEVKKGRLKASYATELIHQALERATRLPAQIGLYWSPSQRKYVPVQYSVQRGTDGAIYFGLTTSTGRKLSPSLLEVCVLGKGMQGSL